MTAADLAIAVFGLACFAAGWWAGKAHWRRKLTELQQRLEGCQARLSAEVDFLQIVRRNDRG